MKRKIIILTLITSIFRIISYNNFKYIQKDQSNFHDLIQKK